MQWWVEDEFTPRIGLQQGLQFSYTFHCVQWSGSSWSCLAITVPCGRTGLTTFSNTCVCVCVCVCMCVCVGVCNLYMVERW